MKQAVIQVPDTKSLTSAGARLTQIHSLPGVCRCSSRVPGCCLCTIHTRRETQIIPIYRLNNACFKPRLAGSNLNPANTQRCGKVVTMLSLVRSNSTWLQHCYNVDDKCYITALSHHCHNVGITL